MQADGHEGLGLYEIECYPRTAEQIPDPGKKPEGKRLRPCRKRTWVRVEDDRKAVIEQGFE